MLLETLSRAIRSALVLLSTSFPRMAAPPSPSGNPRSLCTVLVITASLSSARTPMMLKTSSVMASSNFFSCAVHVYGDEGFADDSSYQWCCCAQLCFSGCCLFVLQ